MSEAGPTTITPEARADAPLSGATVVGVTAVFIGLCTVVVLARMAARFAVHQRLWWDDWTMVVAWIGMIGLCAMQLMLMQHGGGLHIQDVPKSELAKFSTIFSDYEVVARLSIFFAKCSILLLYIRVFFPPRAAKTALYWVIQAVIWLNLLYTISLILVVTLQCVPYGLPEGSTCVNEALVLIMASVINIVSDIAVLIIPLGAVWKLQVGKGKKWGLFALFAFGALAPLASIGRLGYQIPEADGKDRTVIYLIVVLLATAEQAIAIIVGSVPVASAWILRHKAKSSRYGGEQPRTFTERIRPSREQGSSGGGSRGGGSRAGTSKASRGAPDPYQITNITLTGDSVEQLHPQAAYLGGGGGGSRHDKDDGYHYPQDEYQSWMIEDGRTYGLRTTTVHIESSPRY